MKLKISYNSIFIFLLCFHICFSQNPQKKAFLFDELNEVYCSEQIVSWLDSFLVQLANEPSTKGYVIFQGKKAQEGKNLLYFESLRSHIKQRNFDPNRVIFLRAENIDKMIVQFWIVREAAKTPKLQKEFIEEQVDSTTRFDVAWADWHKWNDSEWTIYSYSFVNWGCKMDLNMKAFAETIRSQSNLTGYLVVYPKFGKGKKQARKVTDFAVKELTQQYKISKERLKIIYGGNRNEPQLELWLVPNGNKPPKPNPDKIIKENVK